MNYSTKYEHLTIEKRKVIQALYEQGFSRAYIAEQIGVHRSTVGREITRGGTEVEREVKTHKKYMPLVETVTVYRSNKAQAEADERRKASCKRFKLCGRSEYIKFVEKLILSDKRRYSPDTANALARQAGYETVSTKTWYNWIEWGLVKVKAMDLLLKIRRKPPKKIRIQKRMIGKSIDLRSETVEERQEFGHWEADSIVGAEHRGQIITLIERKQRIGFMFLFENMRAENMVNVLKKLKRRYGKYFRRIFKTITFDNGTEFSYNDDMSKYSEIFYAHAYSSWERGSNENFNGIVRRFIPRGSDITALTQSEIERINHMINTIPRKILNYKTPIEMFEAEVTAITEQSVA